VRHSTFSILNDVEALSLLQGDNALARRLDDEQPGITADTALRLARCFSTTPEFWMNLQQRYELEAVRRAVGSAVERKVVALDLAG
jgi:plasmid maintenance system antidote protein VapI